MDKIVVTGFDPFHETPQRNPSGELALLLANQDSTLHAEVLPTSYERAALQVIDLIKNLKPNLCLMFGYSKTSYSLKLEVYGRNLDTSTSPDNDGQVRRGPIRVAGPERIRTPIALDAIADVLKQEEHNILLSTSAGGFVCNHTYYKVLSYLEGAQVACDGLFVHIPGPKLRDDTVKAAKRLVELLKS